MIIYCAMPSKGDEKFQPYYDGLINHLTTSGHTILCELNPQFKSSVPLTENQIFKRNVKWIESSELFIAEISAPSIGIGFEISYAIFKRRKSVLVLNNSETKYFSSIINGCDSELLTKKSYSTLEELKKIVNKYIINFSDKK